ncbi:hypothetical protein Lalb_Chr00c23g0406291 [Lupinus albus]|uniref:Uncharacterized protein n=1 Tax=Lupinus albus TaxID=3870 RepID=A0A6A4N0U5_LUPAL|nr:hypothetical protein Lalb_Chr00c23g0406291 [Lupinus albus]
MNTVVLGCWEHGEPHLSTCMAVTITEPKVDYAFMSFFMVVFYLSYWTGTNHKV